MKDKIYQWQSRHRDPDSIEEKGKHKRLKKGEMGFFAFDKYTFSTEMFTESFTFNKAKWQDGEVPTLEGALPPPTYDKE